MIDIVTAIIMAIFQGIIEWLPISSEGQLSLIFVNFYGLDEISAVTLALVLHLGTMIAVIWYFRDDLREILNPKSQVFQILVFTTLGTVITAVPLVILFKTRWTSFANTLFLPPDLLFTIFIGVLLIITGVILSKQPDQGIRQIETVSRNEALFLGVTQGFAALPGISRSGITITVLLLIGLYHRDALKISFLISIPAVLGATGLEFLLQGFSLDFNGIIIGNTFFSYPLLLITITLTAIIGILSMDVLIKTKDFPYNKFCIGFGIFTILLGLTFLFIKVVSNN